MALKIIKCHTNVMTLGRKMCYLGHNSANHDQVIPKNRQGRVGYVMKLFYDPLSLIFVVLHITTNLESVVSSISIIVISSSI